MSMAWEDLLFAHWPVPADALRKLIPPGLELDRFENEAWLGVVPFRMADTRLRGLPAVPGTAAFPELNVRTYVTAGGKPGVWFFSLDAGSRLAVRTARTFFHLPYFDARMTVRANDGAVSYESVRTHRGAAAAEFRATYRPLGEIQPAGSGSIEQWLVERYCLYAADRRGRVWRGDIHHAPWPLQRAEAEIERNTMADALSVDLPDTPPLLHFARRLDVAAWRLVAA
jgi:uncharacterized protein YqjF (DUF2071 family)